MRKAIVLLALSLAAGGASADILYGVQIKKVYAQSRQGSDAHLIQISQSLSACNANRLYIDLADTELFARALATYLAEKSVDSSTPPLPARELLLGIWRGCNAEWSAFSERAFGIRGRLTTKATLNK